MMKRWHERYGADLVTINRDCAYFTVKKPVTTKDAALILAYEQFAYCPDMVILNGDGTISSGAADVLNARCWKFWWT